MSTEPEKVYQPFSDDEVAVMRAWQNAHPAEAVFCSQGQHYAPVTTPLYPNIDGLWCPEEGCSDPRHLWAYAYMLEESPGS